MRRAVPLLLAVRGSAAAATGRGHARIADAGDAGAVTGNDPELGAAP